MQMLVLTWKHCGSYVQTESIEANIDANPHNNNGSPEGVQYFDDGLYKERFVIESTDCFKGLLMLRYEKKIKSWIAQHFMAYSVIVLRKLKPY